MDAEAILVVIILVTLGFLGFCVYFIFKNLEFVIRAINLYEKMISREDMMIKLLMDIRDNTKTVSSDDINLLNDSRESVISNSYDSIEDEVDDYEEKNWEELEKEQLDTEDSEPDQQNDGSEQFAEYYDEIRDKLMIELKRKLTSDQELTILNGMSRLSYHELKNMGTKPEDLSEVGLKVYQALMEKIEQYKILNQGNNT